METKRCMQCDQEFSRGKKARNRWRIQRYCSRACTAASRVGRTVRRTGVKLFRDCDQCGCTFEKPSTISVTSWEFRRFCSITCSALAQAGREAPNKGIPGKPWSEERRKKVRARWASRRYETRSQTQSGGTWSKFRRLALERDDWTCADCGLRDADIMTVDHEVPKAIDPSLRYVMENLVSRCPNCHARKTIEDKKLIQSFKKSTTIAAA